MSNSKDLVDYDVRVRDRNVKSGLLRKEDVDSYLSGLVDASAQAQPVEVSQPGVPSQEAPQAAPPPPVQPPMPKPDDGV